MTTQTIINADCLEYMKTLPDKSFDLVLTDPPYGMAYQSSRRTDKHEKIALDTSIEWFEGFAKELYRVMRDDTHAYIFCNEYEISHFRDWLEDAGFTNKRTLVWVKNNHTSGDLEGDYGNKTEFILYAQKGRRLLNGHRDTNVLNFARVSSDNHPTEKPEDLCKYLIEKSTVENETVFDPFAGGGTTLVAAKQLNRDAVGIEISEKYCEIARQRLQQGNLL
jgi:site-specific DNA-methyltransferase (adenine-specific)